MRRGHDGAVEARDKVEGQDVAKDPPEAAVRNAPEEGRCLVRARLTGPFQPGHLILEGLACHRRPPAGEDGEDGRWAACPAGAAVLAVASEKRGLVRLWAQRACRVRGRASKQQVKVIRVDLLVVASICRSFIGLWVLRGGVSNQGCVLVRAMPRLVVVGSAHDVEIDSDFRTRDLADRVCDVNGHRVTRGGQVRVSFDGGNVDWWWSFPGTGNNS